MAEIDVEPKKHRGSILPWLLLGLVVLGLAIYLFSRRHDDAYQARSTQTSTTSHAAEAGWSTVDWNAPRAHYEEITDRNIEVRGNDQYTIYGLGENVLFDKDAASIRSGAEGNLKQIAASINKRYQGGEVRLYGFTDATGSEGHNQELSAQRAAAVKDWLSQHGNIAADRISTEAEGESHPVASNATEEGKQQNRRVEIVARKS